MQEAREKKKLYFNLVVLNFGVNYIFISKLDSILGISS